MAVLRVGDHLGAARRVVRRAVEGNGDDAAAALGDLLLHLRGGDVVGLQDLRKLRHAQADEAGVLHHVENVGEGHAREGVPEIRSESPLDVLIGGKAAGGARERGGQQGKRFAAGHGIDSLLLY